MKHVHLIGAGGIGMSALAHLLIDEGYTVSGSDEKRSPNFDALEERGMKVLLGHHPENISEGTVVYSSAISKQNPELLYAEKKNLNCLHRSDLLNQRALGKKVLQVTGTHGKTTTTALLCHVLIGAKKDPSYVIGGHVPSFKRHGGKGNGEYFVIEGDESDGSFLKTASFSAIVTNCGRDHFAYWKNEEGLKKGFASFFLNVQEDLFWCKDDVSLSELNPKGISYGFSKEADLQIYDFSQTIGGIEFSLFFLGTNYEKIQIPLYGKHNALNASAVFGLSLKLGIREEALREAFFSFSGVKRRLENKGEKHGVVCFDDYAHHPREIQATIDAIHGISLERRVIFLFQPHRYSRTKDFWEEFRDAFKGEKYLFLTDIFGAGESPIEGVTSENLAKQMGATYLPKRDVIEGLARFLRPFDVFVTMGAGDVTEFGAPIMDRVEELGFRYTLGVISGGTSVEHEISRISAENILEEVDAKFYRTKEFYISKEGRFGASKNNKLSPEMYQELLSCDIVFPILHGPRGEDGMIQGFLETIGIPYVGCDYRSAALCMNKTWAKQVALEHQIPVAPYMEFRKTEYEKNPYFFLNKAVELFSFPLWAKPSHLGSSVGVGKANTMEELQKIVKLAFEFDDVLILEEHIEGREIEFAVLGNHLIRTGEPGIILTGGAFYDFERKYGPQGFQIEIPAKISPLEKKIGIELAEKMYSAAGCQGFARVDFFLDHRGVYFFNEINPIPGFASISGYPKMWEAKGVSKSMLINELVILGMRK